ncbi:hydroxylamine reductase [Ruminiclostridium cellulolyticum]|uniref:Hydroxylamine reductase n=1 Tax=Ruminiclostridium cellulolyticum (strain ATCC 35319 / DSM 5812 / JCM 6584 / H10) TaxID=394503 RepID=B8I7X0_RUMCH|nr:hydroxylamine reductase [Ruminiclostridium cellulolyticum]ACL75127.1 hybrid cluster protein [Ruminiclostridium cellulolyticum H10]
MGMFCYQCQETGRNKGCEFGGVCGKSEDLADLQDLLIYTLKGISEIIIKGKLDIKNISYVNHQVIKGLFMTITNANFNDDVIIMKIEQMLSIRNELRTKVSVKNLHDAATFEIETMNDMVYKASYVGAVPKDKEDVRSLKHLILFGIKGLAAYTYHALNLRKEMEKLYAIIYEALAATLETDLTIEYLVALSMKVGEAGVNAMALLDEANTSQYGNPETTKVNIGVRNNPGILISGHDLTDLEQLLEQTKGTGIDVYTHSEMLPSHYYPAFKKYDNLAGNYGNAWWKQEDEFVSFNGPILFTTNCIVPPNSEDVRSRIFTTGISGFPGCVHIESDSNGKKDFSKIIELAKTMKPPVEIEKGSIVGGFGHNQVFALSDKVVNAVKTGAIKKFFVMAGCDGRMESREYYTQFAKKLPMDTVILTAGCAKYRYNKLGLGDIGGIPRVLDAGQCNDSYSLVMIALKLKEVFGLQDINDLPIVYNLSWYEQKAVLVLLALLYLGVRNIHLGPTLPAFLSPNVIKILVDNFGIAEIGAVDDDIKLLMEI